VPSSPQAVRVDATERPSSGAWGVTGAWPLPATFLDHLRLESARATWAYYSGLALVTSTLFISKLLPCVDYPQHLALADVARRLENPNAPEHATHILNYFTYNGLFHFLVAKLSYAMPVEVAGRLVVASSLALLGVGVVALLRVLRRPPSYAALFTPIIFSFSVVWGFANYALATAIAVVTLVAIARTLIKPTIVHVAIVAALGLLCAFAHVLAMLLLCVMAISIAPELSWRASARADDDGKVRHSARALLRIVLALGPLLVGCLFCIKVYREQYPWDPNMYRDAVLEGTMPPIWQKILIFCAFATDLHSDHTDFVILTASIVVVIAAAIVARRQRRLGLAAPPNEAPPLILPLVLLTATYLATPMVLVGTHLIFPRLAQAVMLGAVLAAPSVAGKVGERIRGYCLAVGILCGANLVVHTICFAYETNDASAVIDDLPPGRSATAVIWDPDTFAFRPGTLTHLAAYYGARKHGHWAFSFARYLSVPVRFRPGGQPAWPKKGWEFRASDYDPRCKYARAFDLVLVKAPPDIRTDAGGEAPLRHRVFGEDANAVKLLSHHGHYWAFDTAGLPSDGVL
jgi:hypothetical protein